MKRMTVLILLGVCLESVPLYADEPPEPQRTQTTLQAQREIRQVLAGSDFNHHETTLSPHWRYDWHWPWEHEPEKTDPGDSDWLRALARFFGFIFGHILWLALGVLLIVAWRYRQRWLPLLGSTYRRMTLARPAAKVRITTLDETTIDLPDDITEAAEAARRQGDARLALSLLYRGALATLQRRGLATHDGATEQENLRRVTAWNDNRPDPTFTQLVRAWQAAAYADRPPAEEVIAALIESYRQHFLGGPRT